MNTQRCMRSARGAGNASTIEDFSVEKVVDFKPCKQSIDGFSYRVRWKGMHPSVDSWEPLQSFYDTEAGFDSRSSVSLFKERYDLLLKKKRCSEIASCEDNIDTNRDVDIFSREISEIVDKCTSSSVVYYRVDWMDDGHSSTWEPEENLFHAKDKVEEFLERPKKEPPQKKSRILPLDLQEKEKKERDREFWESLQRGEVPGPSVDLYTKVKRRQLKKFEPSSASGSSRTYCEGKSSSSNIGTSDDECMSGGTEPTPTPIPHVWKRYGGMRPYSTEAIEEELFEQRYNQGDITAMEFEEAVEQDDYPKVLSCIEGGNIPDVDFENLFLSSTRRGRTGMSSLLATCVKDLTVRNEYGMNALSLAANLDNVMLGRILLSLGVPVIPPDDHFFGEGSVSRDNYLKFIEKCKQ